MLEALEREDLATEPFAEAKPFILSSTIPGWYDRQLPLVRSMLGQLLERQLAYEARPADSVNNWEERLGELLGVLEPVETLYQEAQQLPLLRNQAAEEMLEWLLRSIALTYELYGYIRDQEYLRLWSYPGDHETTAIRRGG